MNNDEYYDFENRRYISPTLSSGEQQQFIENFRGIQNQNNQQIMQQTRNLGTDVPSNLGGLTGGESYFNARYQTPQVDNMVSSLKAAAQAQALNDVMSNYQAQLKNRYNQAYRKYQKRQAAKQSPTNKTQNPNYNFKATDLKASKGAANAFSDPGFAYNMTQYMYTPTGEMITEYTNPTTGNTYKFIGDSLVGRDSNGNMTKNPIFGSFYYNALQTTGRFPGDK